MTDDINDGTSTDRDISKIFGNNLSEEAARPGSKDSLPKMNFGLQKYYSYISPNNI